MGMHNLGSGVRDLAASWLILVRAEGDIRVRAVPIKRHTKLQLLLYVGVNEMINQGIFDLNIRIQCKNQTTPMN